MKYATTSQFNRQNNKTITNLELCYNLTEFIEEEIMKYRHFFKGEFQFLVL